MSILSSPPIAAVPAATRIANELRRDAHLEFARMVATHEAGLRKFWSNPDASPAQIAAALGTDALEVFTLHGTLAEVIRRVKPDQPLTSASALGQYSFNPDGSLDVG